MRFLPVRKFERTFVTRDGRRGLLRQLRYEDLEACTEFARGLAEEHASDLHHGTLLASPPGREEEAAWLNEMLLSMEEGMVVNVAAEVEGAFAGNSEVRRGKVQDLRYHGELGIAVAKPYRGIGVGSEMLRALIEESRAAGFRTIQLGALGTNERVIRLYERMGFVRVGLIPGKVQRRGVALDEMVMSLIL